MKFALVFIGCLVFLCRMGSAIDVSAHSAVLYEPRTETMLFEKNADERREIASTTKIMTAIVTLENSDISDVVTVDRSCVNIEGTSMYLTEGEKISVSDLLYGMMLLSGNDAALVLADHVSGGDVPWFINLMNETALRIGMKNTSFKNPNGLPEKGHMSTARDMAKLAAYAMRNPVFSEVVGTKSKTIGNRYLANHNKLLRIYDGATGIKTGYTKAAGRCLVSSAKRGETELIAVTLSAPDDWNDHIKLFDYGFDNYSVYSEKSGAGAYGKMPVVGGNAKDVNVDIACDIALLKEKNQKVNIEIYAPKFLYAPVCSGDCIGRVVYKIDGKEKASESLVCKESVGIYIKPDLWDKILGVLGRIF